MEPEARKRFYEIDLLRFIAALSVVLFHYTYFAYIANNYSPLSYPEIGRFSRYGYLGVELFFMISGFVVLLSAQGKTVKQFFLSRVTRLYPVFWAACTLTFLVEAVWGTRPADTHMASELHASVLQYAYNMTMLYDFLGVSPIDGAYWSLSVEIIFYFLIAILIGFNLLRHLEVFIALWLGYSGIPGLTHHVTPFAILFFPNFAPYFCAGMLFYRMYEPAARTWQRYGLLAVSFVLAMHSASNQAREASVLLQGDTSWKVAMAAIAVFFLVFWLISFRIINFSKFTWLAQLGALTYPLYLIHSDIAFIAFHRIGYSFNKYLVLAVALAAMLTIAWLIHKFIEKKLSKPLGRTVENLLDSISRN